MIDHADASCTQTCIVRFESQHCQLELVVSFLQMALPVLWNMM